MVVKIIDKGIKYILVILMMAISVLAFFQVVTRYVFMNPSTWSEEAIRYLFVWASCLGAAIGIKEKIHIGIDVVVNQLPKTVQKVIALLVHVILICFGATMCYYGWKLVEKTMSQFSPALQIPMGYIYLAVPVMGALVIMYASIALTKHIKNWKEGSVC